MTSSRSTRLLVLSEDVQQLIVKLMKLERSTMDNLESGWIVEAIQHLQSVVTVLQSAAMCAERTEKASV